jgi:hypothetical protein
LKNLKEKDHLGDLSAGGRIILTWILNKRRCAFIYLPWDRVQGPSGSTKGGEFLDQLNNY